MATLNLKGSIGGLEFTLPVEVESQELAAGDDGWTLLDNTAQDGDEFVSDGDSHSRASRTARYEMLAGVHEYELEVISTDGTSEVRLAVGGASLLVPGSDAPGTYTGPINIPASDQMILFDIEDTVARIRAPSVRRSL